MKLAYDDAVKLSAYGSMINITPEYHGRCQARIDNGHGPQCSRGACVAMWNRSKFGGNHHMVCCTQHAKRNKKLGWHAMRGSRP